MLPDSFMGNKVTGYECSKKTFPPTALLFLNSSKEER